jgi:transposase
MIRSRRSEEVAAMMGDELFDDLPEQKGPGREGHEGAPRLRQPERDQIELRAVDLDSLLASDHPARLIWGYVEGLDLSRLYATIKAREGTPGHPPIDPRLMLALWLYATSDGVGSARTLARLCESHDAYRWLCGGVSVNYHTLSDFRMAHPELLDELLAKNVAALAAAGLIDLDTLAQDGVRVRAAAGSSSFRRRAKVEEHLAKARRVVARLKQEVEQDPAVNERRRKAAQERAARERAERVQAAHQKLAEIEEQRQRREKTSAKATAKQGQPRVSLTDPEARVIKMPDGGFRPAYNVQITSAVEQQIIVAIDVTAAGSDAGLARPMLEGLGERGIRPSHHLVDGGFTKKADIEWAHDQGIALYCPPPKSKHGTDPYTPRRSDSPAVRQWRARMASDEGIARYNRRSIHECINARLHQWRLSQFTVRGIAKARIVAQWFALANNILGAHRLSTLAAQA